VAEVFAAEHGSNRRDTQDSGAPALLRDRHGFDRRREVAARDHPIPNLVQVVTQSPLKFFDLFTVDVSYLSLAEAARQLLTLRSSRASQLVGLVKPMFELRLGVAPTDPASLTAATVRAVEELRRSGWEVSGTMESPVRGARGAIEGFVHAVLPPA
jgi:predicted rRNA methylase YqxC with S4 and FtsJ domains